MRIKIFDNKTLKRKEILASPVGHIRRNGGRVCMRRKEEGRPERHERSHRIPNLSKIKTNASVEMLEFDKTCCGIN